MPGIAGVISHEREVADYGETLGRMIASMRHQGSYVSGRCVESSMGVYVGWVAHPGSFAQHQSEARHAEGFEIAFAGECVEAGPSPASAYREHGARGLERLNGLFSGVIVDRSTRRVLLFNDRYGVERVYVHQTRDATYFASEAKALLAVLPSLRFFDDEGVADFLVFGSPLDGRTLFRGITQLPGGSVWTFERGKPRKARYFDPATWEAQTTLSVDDFQATLNDRFPRVLARYITGPSRVGISLTGGIDTRLIMACLPELPVPPICFTFAGSMGDTRDVRVAARVVSACKLDHRVLRIGSDFLSNFAHEFDRTVYATDGCAGALGAHEIYLNRQARELSAIRLTGNFGSEVMRAMSTFKPQSLAPELLTPEFQPQLAASVARRTASASPVTFAAFQEIPSVLFGTMVAAKSQVTFRTPYLDNELVSLAYQAPSVARHSAVPALRLVRQHHEGLARIPTDRGVLDHRRGLAYGFARAAAELTFKLDYMDKEALPQSLKCLDGAFDMLFKMGLAGAPHRYLPYRRWFKVELAPFLQTALAEAGAMETFWNKAVVRTLVRGHVEGRRNYVREINAVVTLAAVARLLLRPYERPSIPRSLPIVVGAG